MPTRAEFEGMFGKNIGRLCTPHEVKVDRGNLPPAKAIIYTEPSPAIQGMLGKANQHIGEGFVVIHEEQFSGSWSWAMVHISRILAEDYQRMSRDQEKIEKKERDEEHQRKPENTTRVISTNKKRK